MLTIPDDWKELLSELQTQDPSAILAGGAIRDLHTGVQPKDLDFFCNDQTAAYWKFRSGWSTNYSKKASEYAIDGEDQTTVTDVVEIKRERWFADMLSKLYGRTYSLPSLNLIHCQPWGDPINLLNRFDFGICQAAWDGKQIITTEHFQKDLRDKTFTLRHARTLAKAKERYERIGKRYPGWRMEISGPAHYQIMIARFKAKGELHVKTASYW